MKYTMNILFSGLQRISQNQAKLWKWSFIMITTYFLAKTVSRIIAGLYFPLELPDDGDIDNSRSRRSEARVEVSRILDRNIFDSRAKEAKLRPNGDDFNSQDIRPSNLAADLLGTLDFQNSIFSAALIRDRSSNTQAFYRKNDSLQDSTVVKIERHRVIIEKNGRLEYLELAAAKSSLKPGPVVKAGSASEEVKQVDENRFEVSGASLQSYLSDPALLTSARAVPFTDASGKIVGFKIVDMQETSVFKKLGIQRGDVIKAVNGDPVNGIDKVMQLVTAMRTEKRISLDIERNGVGVNYIYDIR